MKLIRNIWNPAAQCLLAISGALAMTVAQSQTVISEVLYDAAGTDNGNVFVELFGTPGTDLEGLLLEGVNGADGVIYSSIPLSGVITSYSIHYTKLYDSSRFSCRWLSQPGWVKSPVPTTLIPFMAAQAASPCRWLNLLVARE